MGARAVRGAPDPDDWDIVDAPDQGAINPPNPPPRYLRYWRKWSRLLLLHGWYRGEFAAVGQYLKWVKSKRLPHRPDADPGAAGRGPPGDGEDGTTA